MDPVTTNMLAERAAQILGLSKIAAVNYALRRLISSEAEVKGLAAKDILHTAASFEGGFTMDSLIDSLFGDEPVFSPHAIKIRVARVLIASGYKRKQQRRDGKRPLIWSSPPQE